MGPCCHSRCSTQRLTCWSGEGRVRAAECSTHRSPGEISATRKKQAAKEPPAYPGCRGQQAQHALDTVLGCTAGWLSTYLCPGGSQLKPWGHFWSPGVTSRAFGLRRDQTLGMGASGVRARAKGHPTTRHRGMLTQAPRAYQTQPSWLCSVHGPGGQELKAPCL